MPALTPEQEALKQAAMQFKVHGMFTPSHGRFNELANVDAILDLLARLEAVQPIPDVLFNGYAVYEEVRRKAGHMRTSPENVSDVLDAAVRLIRAAKAAPGEPGQ